MKASRFATWFRFITSGYRGFIATAACLVVLLIYLVHTFTPTASVHSHTVDEGVITDFECNGFFESKFTITNTGRGTLVIERGVMSALGNFEGNRPYLAEPGSSIDLVVRISPRYWKQHQSLRIPYTLKTNDPFRSEIELVVLAEVIFKDEDELAK